MVQRLTLWVFMFHKLPHISGSRTAIGTKLAALVDLVGGYCTLVPCPILTKRLTARGRQNFRPPSISPSFLKIFQIFLQGPIPLPRRYESPDPCTICTSGLGVSPLKRKFVSADRNILFVVLFSRAFAQYSQFMSPTTPPNIFKI